MNRFHPLFLIMFGAICGLLAGLAIAKDFLDQQVKALVAYREVVDTLCVKQTRALAVQEKEYYHNYAILLVKTAHFVDAIQQWNKLHPGQQYYMNIDDKILRKDMGL